MFPEEVNVETLRTYCLEKPFVTEEFPFDDVTLVFKVAGKMYALIPLDEPQLVISLKCNPERSLELRDAYPSIQPAYHMNKTHWNMIFINGNVPKSLLQELINHSYDLVFNSLPKKTRLELLG
jgi:predicted DNA-binding protein (MmcQ/YjbR family)